MATHLIVGVVQDECDLVREQPEVDRVEDRPHARNSEVHFEVLLMVPAEGRNSVAVGHAEPGQSAREASRPPSHVGVGRADRAVANPSHDLFLAEEARPMVESAVSVSG